MNILSLPNVLALVKARPGKSQAPRPTPIPAQLKTELLMLKLFGFQPGLPPWLTAASAAIDAEQCQSRACEECGHRGTLYSPFHRLLPMRGYRVLAICPRCLHAEAV